MAAPLTVKAYLQRENVSLPEIRRFSLRTELGKDTFKVLQDKLVEVFPNLKAGCFTLHWKDEDDDLVKFCSHDELQHALSMLTDDVLRIYITADEVAAEEIAEVADMSSEDISEKTPARKHMKLGGRFAHPFYGRMWMHPAWPGHGMRFKKMKKIMKKEAKIMKKAEKKMADIENKEFLVLKSQVPSAFRSWVRQYVKVWFSAGRSAAAKLDSIPEGAPPNFREWLDAYLEKLNKKQEGQAAGDTDKNTMEQDDDLPVPPEGLPTNYYQWLRLFVKRFLARLTRDSSNSDFDESDDPFIGHFWNQGAHVPWDCHMRGFRHGRHWRKGKHDRHGWSASDSDEERLKKRKLWKTISPEMRKYVRELMKNLHKGDKGKQAAKKETTPEGLNREAVEFIQQFIAEWHAKLTSLPPREVSIAMAKEERTGLPKGIENKHVQWLCRFLARWHHRHAGNCEGMAGWSSNDTSDDTSGNEQEDSNGAGYGMGCPFGRGRKHHFSAMRSFPPFWGHHGMHRHPHHGMHFGFPPSPMMLGGMAPHFRPHPFWGQMYPGLDGGCPFQGMPEPFCGGREYCEKGKQCKPQTSTESKAPGSGQSAGQEDEVSTVTEALRKM